MKITKLMAAAALLLSFGVVGCTDDITDEVSQLTRNTDEVSVAYNKDATASFSIRVPGAWSASVACKNASGASTSAWLKLDPAEGVGNGKDYQWINVIADRNKEGKREAVITVAGVTRGDAVEIKVAQDAGIFEIGAPSISGSLNEGVESTASLEIDYKKALGNEKIVLEATFEGDNFGLSIDKKELVVETEGDGSWKLPIAGTPNHMGDVTIKLKVTVDGASTEKTLTYAINPETLVYKFSFDKFIWGGDTINNKPGKTPNPDGSGATKEYVGTEPADYTCTRGIDGAGDCFATMSAEYRKNRDISDWDGSKVYEHPGYVKISTGSAGGWIMTPPLSGVAGTMDLDVTFKIAYVNETGGKHDNIIFAVEGAGKVDGNAVLSMPSASSAAEVATNGWTTITMKVLNATSNTRLKWSAVDLTSKVSRFMLDDIVVEGAKKLTAPLSPVDLESITYTATENSITFSWNAVADASKYELALSREATPDFKQTVETVENTYTFDNLEEDYYILSIRAIYAPDENWNSESVSVVAATQGLESTQLDTPVPVVETTAWTAAISWNAVSRASGYEYTLKDGEVVVDTGIVDSDVTSVAYKKLTESHEYEFSVRALYARDSQYDSEQAVVKVLTKDLTVEAPTNLRLYAKSPTTLTFEWDDTNPSRAYTMQYATEASEDAAKLAEYSYKWTTKSTAGGWPWDYPTRMTIVSFMNEDRSIGSEENLIRPGKTYYFRVRCGNAADEGKWSEWLSATTDTRTAPAGEIFYEGFDNCFVGGGDWLNQAAGTVIVKDANQTDIWHLKWNTSLSAAVTTFGNIYTAGNLNTELASWIGYTRIWDRGNGTGDLQPCPGYVKCGNGSNVGAYRILALGTDKLASEGENVTLTFKATPWSEVTSGAGYTMDNKLVDIYVNDDVVATDVRISDSNASDGDPAVMTDMKWKTISIEIPGLKPSDQIMIKSKTNEAVAERGRFFLDEVSVVKK